MVRDDQAMEMKMVIARAAIKEEEYLKMSAMLENLQKEKARRLWSSMTTRGKMNADGKNQKENEDILRESHALEHVQTCIHRKGCA